MAEQRGRGFLDAVKAVIGVISPLFTALFMPSLTQGVDIVLDRVEARLLLLEKKLFRKLTAYAAIAFGAIFLLFALFFVLKEVVGWTNASAFFAIGITLFIVGLLLKLRDTAHEVASK